MMGQRLFCARLGVSFALHEPLMQFIKACSWASGADGLPKLPITSVLAVLGVGTLIVEVVWPFWCLLCIPAGSCALLLCIFCVEVPLR